MCSRFLSLLLIAGCCTGADPRILRVCADPNNLPFSNEAQQGFENRLADLIARELNAKVEYTWWSERKSFIRDSLDAGRCDVLMGVPTAMGAASVTKPYYESTYVFVSLQSRRLHLTSLFDPQLETLRIGVHVVGDDYTPPAHALARRGLAANLTGYSMFGSYGEANPPGKLVEAVVRGDVDLAIVWGPFAGYFAKEAAVPLDISPVAPKMFLAVPFTYQMSMGVRKGDDGLRAELDRALQRRCTAVQSLLHEYAVPLVAREGGSPECDSSRPPESASSR